MKLLWQHILSVVTVIIISLGISAYLINHYMAEQIYNQKQEELVQYGVHIVQNQFRRTDLERVTQLLGEDVVIQVYLADGTVIYPSYDQRNKLQLSQDQLERITNDEMIGIQKSYRYRQDGQMVTMATVYVSNKGGYSEFPEGFISIGAPLDELNEQVEAVQKNILVGFVLSSIIGIVLAVSYAYYQSNKIKRLQLATREIASGNYEIQIKDFGFDEFGDLSRDFQTMAEVLQKSQEEIQRQETLRRQMMMDVAHEMRTPLTTMSGVLEGLQYDMIPESQKERSLELVMRETQRLIRLVNENLDYEKIRNRQIVLKKQWVPMTVVFEQIVIQLHQKAAEKNNNVVYEVSEDFKVWADYDRLVQVLINLVTNAIQFSENSEIKLSAFQGGKGATIIVEDHGIGIDAKQIESIWERFYKADISRKSTAYGESGIGLAVVKSLIEAHDGTITVESQLGEGTRFVIEIPLPEEQLE